MVSLLKIAGLLVEDAFRWLLLLFRSAEALRAENLFLRRQLALYIERGVQPQPGRRGYPRQPGATGQALRLARRAGGRAAGDDDSLASRRLETALANEVSARSASDPDRTARADPQDGPGERVVGRRAHRQRTAAQAGNSDLAANGGQVPAETTSWATPRRPALVDVPEKSGSARAQKSESRRSWTQGALVRAKPVLGGLHHEYFALGDAGAPVRSSTVAEPMTENADPPSRVHAGAFLRSTG